MTDETFAPWYLVAWLRIGGYEGARVAALTAITLPYRSKDECMAATTMLQEAFNSQGLWEPLGQVVCLPGSNK
jgi:hypothetical protein